MSRTHTFKNTRSSYTTRYDVGLTQVSTVSSLISIKQKMIIHLTAPWNSSRLQVNWTIAVINHYETLTVTTIACGAIHKDTAAATLVSFKYFCCRAVSKSRNILMVTVFELYNKITQQEAIHNQHLQYTVCGIHDTKYFTKQTKSTATACQSNEQTVCHFRSPVWCH